VAKDYAKENSRPVRAAGSGGMAHPMLMGIIIGMLLGIIIALAVALWLNRLSNPFVEKGKQIEPLPKIGAAQPPPPPEAAKAAEKAAEKAKAAPEKPASADAKKGAKNERPRFEFYQILPGEKEVTDKDVKTAKAAPPPPPKATDEPKPGSSPKNPKAFSGEVYWLQAGAFASESDADNLKAKIALTGLEASVRPATVDNKGTLYRVRLGPYQSVDDANRIKTTLSQNGVATAIIRTTEDTKK